MQTSPEHKTNEGEPGPDDLLTIPQIARLYGVKAGSVRLWKLQPAETVILGTGRKLKLYRRSDVESYANSERRQNRLKAQKIRPA